MTDGLVYEKCQACGGRGRLPTASSLRAFRISKQLRLRDVAKSLGFTTSYLSDVERGRRAVTLAIARAYQELQCNE